MASMNRADSVSLISLSANMTSVTYNQTLCPEIWNAQDCGRGDEGGDGLWGVPVVGSLCQNEHKPYWPGTFIAGCGCRYRIEYCMDHMSTSRRSPNWKGRLEYKKRFDTSQTFKDAEGSSRVIRKEPQKLLNRVQRQLFTIL